MENKKTTIEEITDTSDMTFEKYIQTEEGVYLTKKWVPLFGFKAVEDIIFCNYNAKSQHGATFVDKEFLVTLKSLLGGTNEWLE